MKRKNYIQNQNISELNTENISGTTSETWLSQTH